MSAFRLRFSRPILDRLLRLKNAPPQNIFPDLPAEHVERLAGVMQGQPCTVWDSHSEGLSLLIAMGPPHKPCPTITMRCTYYEPGKPSAAKYRRLGRWPSEIDDVDKARQMARDIRSAARAGEAVSKQAKAEVDRLAAATQAQVEADRLDVMVDRYIRYKRQKGVRTWKDSERLLEAYALAEWGGRDVRSISKRDVTLLLDKVAAGQIESRGKLIGTPSVSSAVYAQLASFFRWYQAVAEDAFAPPVHTMMRVGKPLPRERVLSDDELQILWPAWEASGVYGKLCQTALLTAQRFRKVGAMRRTELHQHFVHGGVALTNVWAPSAAGEAPNKRASIVPLSDLAVSVIAALPVVDGSDWTFTNDGRTFSQFARNHARLDATLRAQGTPVEWWQGRDLRRCARTLLSRAGVSNETGEHCLGHSLPIIQRTYNRFDYLEAKQQAFAALASLVLEIVGAKASTTINASRKSAAGQ